MAIEVVRIDDRLIHGQIVQGWLKIVKVNKILIVSDEVAKDQMQQVLLSMAMPTNVELIIKNISEASQELLSNKYKDDKIMILFSNPQDIVKVLNNGFKFSSINAGGMHYAHGKEQILPNLSVDEQDVKSFLKIMESGIEIEGRILPSDERHSISQNIKEQAKKLKLIG